MIDMSGITKTLSQNGDEIIISGTIEGSTVYQTVALVDNPILVYNSNTKNFRVVSYDKQAGDELVGEI